MYRNNIGKILMWLNEWMETFSLETRSIFDHWFSHCCTGVPTIDVDLIRKNNFKTKCQRIEEVTSKDLGQELLQMTQI